MKIFIENPTLEQRKTLRYIVYLITNLLNNRDYVGETKQTFFLRYCAKKWWTQLDNKELRKDILNFGVENFKITLLEQDVCDVIERRKLEDYYAIKYNAYYPVGYNIAQCGLKANYREAIAKGIEKLRESMKTIIFKDSYEFVNPNGDNITIKNLPKFCKDNNLDVYGMINVNNGKRKHCKGYSNPKNPIKIYDLISPNGFIYRVRDEEVVKFSLEQGLNMSDLCYLTREQCKIYHGWRLLKNKDINPLEKIYKLKSPLGHVYRFTNITHFAKEHNLDISYVSDLLKGQIKQHRSWSLETTELEVFWLLSRKKKLYRVVDGWEVYEFGRKHHLSMTSVRNIGKRKVQSYKGWTAGNEPIDYQI